MTLPHEPKDLSSYVSYIHLPKGRSPRSVFGAVAPEPFSIVYNNGQPLLHAPCTHPSRPVTGVGFDGACVVCDCARVSKAFCVVGSDVVVMATQPLTASVLTTCPDCGEQIDSRADSIGIDHYNHRLSVTIEWSCQIIDCSYRNERECWFDADLLSSYGAMQWVGEVLGAKTVIIVHDGDESGRHVTVSGRHPVRSGPGSVFGAMTD